MNTWKHRNRVAAFLLAYGLVGTWSLALGQSAKQPSGARTKRPATEAEIVASLKGLADQVAHSIEDVQEMQPQGTGTSGTFINGYGRRLTLSYDVRKTDSLVSPYLGTVNMNFEYHITVAHKSMAEAQADHDFPKDYRHWFLVELVLTYAYQDGGWVKKDLKNISKPEPTPDRAKQLQRWIDSIPKLMARGESP